MNKPLNIAHRGNSCDFIENTLNSFKSAMDIGVDGIELDVHLTLDNHLVIFHDSSLIRLTGNKFSMDIGTLTRSELEIIPLVDNERIIFLDTFLKHLNDNKISIPLQIEIKNQLDNRPIGRELISLLDSYNYLTYTIISSFNIDYLKDIKKYNTSIKTLFLSRSISNLKKLDDNLTENKVDGIHFNINFITKDICDYFKEKGYIVGAWKVKSDKKLMEKVIELNLDRATVDDPRSFKALLG